MEQFTLAILCQMWCCAELLKVFINFLSYVATVQFVGKFAEWLPSQALHLLGQSHKYRMSCMYKCIYKTQMQTMDSVTSEPEV